MNIAVITGASAGIGRPEAVEKASSAAMAVARFSNWYPPPSGKGMPETERKLSSNETVA